ncbi:MAG: TetR/AcrR family transcriptional regulator [Hyphomonadaceae bacterium]|nr:TetR/AcrR family transcriptional regulator [Hyphomonadaceae bacterium]
MDDKTNTRDRILLAAMNRIKHYGYGKTTMAEIASDCCMSPGNIYRFFEAKIDIAEAMARKHYAEEQAEMAALARKKEWSVDRRLREIFFKRLRDSFRIFEDNAKILEVAEVLHRERPLFANEQLALERVFLSALLEEGAKAGLFVEGDYAFMAEMMQCATMKYGLPQLWSRLTLPKLERELGGVLDLLFSGLYARAEEPARVPRAREEALA